MARLRPYVGHCLKRGDVIGGPLAHQVFAICDTFLLQDPRLAALWDAPAEDRERMQLGWSATLYDKSPCLVQ
jgi:hypothetical protein